MKHLIFLFISTLTILNDAKGQHNTYYVGHSGFGFSEYNLIGRMVGDLALDAGINSYDYGDQIIGGSCLSVQWENHASSATGDSWTDIPSGNLSGQYDYLIVTELIPITEALDMSLAPWTGCNLTPYVALDNFYNLAKNANPNAKIYVMEFHNEADFTLGGTSTVYNNWSNLNSSNRPLWEQVADSIAQMNGGQVCLIPIAASMQALADSVISGNFPGITNFIDIFEPTDGVSWKIHYTDITTYLGACVHFATIFEQSPIDLTNELSGRTVGAGTAPTPQQALIMQKIAWEVVSNDIRTCINLTPNFVSEENITKLNFTVYPNPSNGIINIPKLTNIENFTIQVIDMSGKKVFEILDSNQSQFDLNLSSGIYSIKISTSKFTEAKKIIIGHH